MRSLPLRTRRWDQAIQDLDPEKDAQAILRILGEHVFPLEILVALELAQLRTFTIPTISKILHATRQYEDEGQKRLDDTRAIITEIFQSAPESRAEQEMVAHLNRIHSLYRIENDDFLYTLSTFVFDPWLFIERYGHRRYEPREKRAAYVYWRRIGEAMHIRGIPGDFDGFLAWRRAYEARAQRYSPDNEAVARGFLRAAESVMPAPLRPHLETILVALIDEEGVREALGLAPVSAAVATSIRVAMDLRRRVARHINPYEQQPLSSDPFFSTYPTYPDGYDRLRLGPTKVLGHLAKGRVNSAGMSNGAARSG